MATDGSMDGGLKAYKFEDRGFKVGTPFLSIRTLCKPRSRRSIHFSGLLQDLTGYLEGAGQMVVGFLSFKIKRK
jgi:hypothetical protein